MSAENKRIVPFPNGTLEELAKKYNVPSKYLKRMYAEYAEKVVVGIPKKVQCSWTIYLVLRAVKDRRRKNEKKLMREDEFI